MIKKISIIGSGNVATHLGLAFKYSGVKIQEIISRNKESGFALSKKLDCMFNNQFANFLKTDLIIICVKDDNIKEVIKKLPNISMIHTSGSTDISVFDGRKNTGVLYPVQTLKKEIKIEFKSIPICIEANNEVFKKKLISLGNKISNKIYYLNSFQRKHIHLAAVIVSNFSNFCYIIAKKHLDNYEIDFSLLFPLIIKTANNITESDPIDNQTGPAKRGDNKIINEHLKMMKNKNYKKIYQLLSQNILEEYEK